jgi:hypothetical protein
LSDATDAMMFQKVAEFPPKDATAKQLAYTPPTGL